MRRKNLIPFAQHFGKPRESVGGARPAVEKTARAMEDSNAPMLVARMYAPASVAHYDESDPRFRGNSEQVENLYLQPNEKPRPRSGLAQVFNWLMNGELR